MERVKPETRDTINARLEGLIEQAGSVTAFARSIDVSRDIVNNWVLDRSDIRVGDLVKISQRFGVSVDYLLGLADSPTKEPDKQAAEGVTGLSPEAISMLAALKTDKNKHLLTALSNAIASPIFVFRVLTAIAAWEKADRSDSEFFKALSADQSKTIGDLQLMSAVVLAPEEAQKYYGTLAFNALSYYLESQSKFNSKEIKDMFKMVESDLLQRGV